MSQKKLGHIAGLDGIRGLAITLVLLMHSVVYGEFTRYEAIGTDAGAAGVTVFFVLSGFLITSLLLREEERVGRVSLRLFYARRSLRLFPALWLYLFVVWLLWLAGLIPDHPWHSFVSSLLYIRNLVGSGHETRHLWSLSIEEQFYLLWPLLFVALAGRDRARLAIALTIMVAVTAWRLYAAATGLASEGALYTRSDFRFDAPITGCALALMLRVAPGSLRWTNSTAARSSALAIGGVLVGLLWVGLRLTNAAPTELANTMICFLTVLLILSQIGVPGAGSRWLAWMPLVALGQISYGVYLWQQLFLGPKIRGFETLRTFPVGLIATFLVALLSYMFLERPLLRLKDRRFHPVESSRWTGHASAVDVSSPTATGVASAGPSTPG